MIIGAHTILYSKDADADRAFIRDVLGFSYIDAGRGWLIFALPPAEIAVHPSDENNVHEFCLMTDDIAGMVTDLSAKGVACTPLEEPRWGSLTRVTLPGGGQLGIYQPKHPTAF